MFEITNILLLLIFIAIVWVSISITTYLFEIRESLKNLEGQSRWEVIDKTYGEIDVIKTLVRDISNDISEIRAQGRYRDNT